MRGLEHGNNSLLLRHLQPKFLQAMVKEQSGACSCERKAIPGHPTQENQAHAFQECTPYLNQVPVRAPCRAWNKVHAHAQTHTKCIDTADFDLMQSLASSMRLACDSRQETSSDSEVGHVTCPKNPISSPREAQNLRTGNCITPAKPLAPHLSAHPPQAFPGGLAIAPPQRRSTSDCTKSNQVPSAIFWFVCLKHALKISQPHGTAAMMAACNDSTLSRASFIFAPTIIHSRTNLLVKQIWRGHGARVARCD